VFYTSETSGNALPEVFRFGGRVGLPAPLALTCDQTALLIRRRVSDLGAFLTSRALRIDSAVS
jgi:hypothetical protein